MLSENDIKQAFLPFLKEFYKYRYEYRPDSVKAELDKVSAGGLIADGMVSFLKEDGSTFVCTYEATSLEKADEVKFTLNRLYFIWDCLACGAIVAVASYAAAYVLNQSWLVGLQWSGNLGFVFGTGLIGYLMWYFTMRGWKKYRYIYAIEQFKQYFAHEQWIALAEEVFPAATDPYLVELRSQCVYNGFGLALVPFKGEIRVLNAPSRLGIYGKDRAMVQWVTKSDWYQTMSQNMHTLTKFKPVLSDDMEKYWNKIWRPFRYLFVDQVKKKVRGSGTAVSKQRNTALDRYMRGQSVQKWIFGLSLLAITPLAYRVLTIHEDNVNDVVERPASNPEDQYGYLYESETVRPRDPRGIPKQYPDPAQPAVADIPTIDLSGNENDDEVQTINLSGDDDEQDVQTINLSGDETKIATKAVAASDPCATYQAEKGWIVQDNSYQNKTFADERAAALKRKGIECTVIAKVCLGEGSGYILRLGKVQQAELQAVDQAENYTKAMERYGLLQGTLLVRRING